MKTEKHTAKDNNKIKPMLWCYFFAQIQPVIMDKMEKSNNILVVPTLFYTCQPYNPVTSPLLVMSPCGPTLSIHVILTFSPRPCLPE